MRQFASWRVWAAILVVVMAASILRACAGDDGPAVSTEGLVSRRLDLISLTATIRSDAPWYVSDGAMSGDATVVLANGRVVQLTDGTLGESSCLFPDVLNACVLLADTLGDGVVWFALLPAPASASNELELPAINSLLDGVTYARLDNGWEVPLLDRVVRRCETETPNLSSFVQRFADRHVTVIDLERAEVSAVRCLEN
ncbi:MAG: hypothetical protein O3B66_02635 [Actinomycetota bacterium]|nr:hypothetical protein [Actinomycetota bacterium]MDA3011723.1 hypothetical protein [Actinomycetota bacterium]MDA3024425.1 hypothetical protein [Actinomycetota bacterium]